jgi:hypothetical protein
MRFAVRSPSMVDPRLRGENITSSSGRPPHAQGEQKSIFDCVPTLWSTPACAGRTIWLNAWSRTVAVDPRMRGENCQAIIQPPVRRGRPPPAGRTERSFPPHPVEPAHPRVRGEDAVKVKNDEEPDGRSRMHGGKGDAETRPKLVLRNTPAARGKTTSMPFPDRSGPEHPRCVGKSPNTSLWCDRPREYPCLRGEN